MPEIPRLIGGQPQVAGEHATLVRPIRLIVATVLVFVLALAVLRAYGIPTLQQPQGMLAFLGGLAIIGVFVPMINVAPQWEKAAILRLGRFAGVRGPGVFLVLTGIESAVYVDLRLKALTIPSQKAVTGDNIPVNVDASVFYSIRDAGLAVTEVQDYHMVVQQFAQAALRDVVGTLSLDELLTAREKVQETIQRFVEQRVQSIGIHIDSIRLLDVGLPDELLKMVARQAGAAREAKASIEKAAGDKIAALNLADAAATMLNSPGAMQLRTLQTIDGLGASNSNTVILLPFELVELVRGLTGQVHLPGPQAPGSVDGQRACPQCGGQLGEQSRFCSQCGADAGAGAAQTNGHTNGRRR